MSEPTRTEQMLRPSQWPVGRTYNADGERIGVDAWIKGGVRVWTLHADGSFTYGATSGRRKYRVYVEDQD